MTGWQKFLSGPWWNDECIHSWAVHSRVPRMELCLNSPTRSSKVNATMERLFQTKIDVIINLLINGISMRNAFFFFLRRLCRLAVVMYDQIYIIACADHWNIFESAERKHDSCASQQNKRDHNVRFRERPLRKPFYLSHDALIRNEELSWHVVLSFPFSCQETYCGIHFPPLLRLLNWRVIAQELFSVIMAFERLDTNTIVTLHGSSRKEAFGKDVILFQEWQPQMPVMSREEIDHLTWN